MSEMSERDFAGKVEWEGGIYSALDYGLRSKDCAPGPLHDAWAAIEVKWDEMYPERTVLEDILDRLGE